MAKHGWTVLCTRSIVDRETSQVSLIDAVDRLNIHTPQLRNDYEKAVAEDKVGVAFDSKLALVSFWYRSDKETPETGGARLRKIDPSGRVVVDQPFSVSLEVSSVHRTFFAVPMFKFSGFGRYYFVIEQEVSYGDPNSEWAEVARLPLDVLEDYKATDSSEPEPHSSPLPSSAS